MRIAVRVQSAPGNGDGELPMPPDISQLEGVDKWAAMLLAFLGEVSVWVGYGLISVSRVVAEMGVGRVVKRLFDKA